MKKLFDSKKATIAIVVVNIVLLVYLSVYLLMNRTSIFTKNDVSEVNNNVEQLEILQEQVATDDTDAVLAGSWAQLISNYTFTMKDGKVFSFGSGKSYEGYFDEANEKVTGYLYNVEVIDKNFYLVIEDPMGETKVSYKMDITPEGNFEISNILTGESMMLEF